MRKIYLHIGFGKTGSSALQSWLSLNTSVLAKQGIDYADLVPEAKFGQVSAGNGYVLFQAFQRQDFVEAERLITSSYFFSANNNIAIISCELLKDLPKPTIQELKDICERNAISVSPIAYFRSVYEHSYSAYLQGLKRSQATHFFGEESSDFRFPTIVKYVEKYLEVFGDDFTILNYDEAKTDIYTSFSEVTGIHRRGIKKLRKRVNRSLTMEEAETLRRINTIHKGIFSNKISDHIIHSKPNLDTTVFYDAALVDKMRTDAGEKIEWINRKFNLSCPLAVDFYTGQESNNAVTLHRKSFKFIVRWAMDFAPNDALIADFAIFLDEFSNFMDEFSHRDAQALRKKLSAVQKDSAARNIDLRGERYPSETTS
jgi:hypothetical protein